MIAKGERSGVANAIIKAIQQAPVLLWFTSFEQKRLGLRQRYIHPSMTLATKQIGVSGELIGFAELLS
jgi:hypothetical protein